MATFKLKTPEGTKDYLFEECRNIRATQKAVINVFQNYGFSEIMTPELEFLDVFNRSYFQIENMYKLVDQKGRLLVLRPDSTIPTARVVATRLKNAALPLKLYNTQNILKSNESLKGAQNIEFQCSVEIIGADGINSDLEVIHLAAKALSATTNNNFRLEIGHNGIFSRLIELSGFDDDLKEEIRLKVQEKNYPAISDILAMQNVSDKQVLALGTLPRLFGDIKVLDTAYSIFTDEKIVEILDYLKKLYSILTSLNINIDIDLGIVNRAAYYTGVIFHGYILGFGSVVLAGGRYNNLLDEFGLNLPATGFGINIGAISENIEFETTEKEKIILFAKAGFEKELFEKADTIKDKTVIISSFESLDETKAYAKSLNIDEVIVIGE